MLEILHPALPDCEACQKYQYNFEERKFERNEGTKAYRKRVTPCPCRTPKGCPKGTPENPRTLWKSNRKAYEFYLECEATGNFPDDAYVRWLARVIREVKQEAQSILSQRDDFSLFKVLTHVASSRHRPDSQKR